ncbi:MAG TPA: hypothetical protein VFI11_15425 [Anaerolineales bacterium]|nr:hypothetical protein [Anaerolineales bacterium]
MDQRTRSGLVAGILLVLVGLAFLAVQLVPGLEEALRLDFSWPLIVVAVGVGLLLMGLLTSAPGMAVPAFIVAGIGGILYWQNATGQWTSWSYAWALIPGFAGLGTIVAAILGEGGWRAASRGAEAILVSLVMFAVFGSLFGGWAIFGPFWPVLLIVLGLVMLIRAFVRRSTPA